MYRNVDERKVLAKTTLPTEPSPVPVLEDKNQEDELGVESDIPKPSFSLDFEGTGDNGDEDSFQMQPPRLSLPIEESDYTERSTEMGRRAISEQQRGTMSRGIFGTMRMTDRFSDMTELQSDTITEGPDDETTLQRQTDSLEDHLEEIDEEVELGLVESV